MPYTLQKANPMPSTPISTMRRPPVDLILAEAVRSTASDVHFEPTNHASTFASTASCINAACRTQRPGTSSAQGSGGAAHYRQDITRRALTNGQATYSADMRVSTFPTIHGEKRPCALRAAAAVLDLRSTRFARVVARRTAPPLPASATHNLLTGPSGSGRTTTLYACLLHLLRDSGGGRHIVTIEDPVEQVLEGIANRKPGPAPSSISPRGLRSLLRQDPEIIMVGEVRDPDTAHRHRSRR